MHRRKLEWGMVEPEGGTGGSYSPNQAQHLVGNEELEILSPLKWRLWKEFITLPSGSSVRGERHLRVPRRY